MEKCKTTQPQPPSLKLMPFVLMQIEDSRCSVKRRGTAQGLGPPKMQVVILSGLLGWRGRDLESHLFQTSASKILKHPGSLTIFFGSGKVNFRSIILSFKAPRPRARMIRDAGRVQGKKLFPKASFCSREPACSACLSSERLCNSQHSCETTDPACQSLPPTLTWSSRSLRQRVTSASIEPAWTTLLGLKL